jgi:hypothetical protein
LNTQTLRLPLNDPATPLADRINTLCDVQLAAGFGLAAVFVFGDQLYLIFQKSS